MRKNGYTVAELLVVIAVILIVMTLVVPRMENGTKRTNEQAAINSLRMVNQMEGEYTARYPALGYTCRLQTLGGDPKLGVPTAEAAQLITDDTAKGLKSGFRFAFADCDSGKYRVTAVPVAVGKTGDRGFCIDESGRLAFDPRGGVDCTEALR